MARYYVNLPKNRKRRHVVAELGNGHSVRRVYVDVGDGKGSVGRAAQTAYEAVDVMRPKRLKRGVGQVNPEEQS